MKREFIFLFLIFKIYIFQKIERKVSVENTEQTSIIENKEIMDKKPLVIFFLTLIILLCLVCKKLNKISGIPSVH